jgi:subtilase family serine protease
MLLAGETLHMLMKETIKKIIFIVALLAGSAVLFAPSPASARPVRVIDDNDTVTLRGNVHPHARAEFDRGAVSSSLPIERMILALRRDPQKQAELEKYLIELHDPASSNFHRWLTPREFGARFGPPAEDIDAITGWLRSHGFVVEEVARSGAWINFSGSAGNVERAFHTPIHTYLVNGRTYHANAQDPAIPRGLSDVVAGVVTLHDFPRKVMNSGARPLTQAGISPDYTYGTSHYLSPGDFSTIYNVSALYAVGIDGSGQSIAIVGRAHPPASNWTTFRSMMGLPANPPQVIVNGPDPGALDPNENAEADLDVEWSGAVAKNAAIIFVTSKSTYATDGVDLSAQYIVNNNLSPVMSTSFGSCEAELGTAENIFYNNLWQQAAAQGISSFVSSGDSGAAGCDPGSASAGTGLGVNGLASTPYNIAVGGTQFNEGAGSYWSTTNGPGYASALSYIPEITWNESGSMAGGAGLWATGGGASSRYARPAWQTAPGVPANGKRTVPDVSLNAAAHVAYLVQSQGALYAINGTSASSPSFAGLMALVVQKTGQRQGNANTRLYQLGNAQYASGGEPVFHDITSGNNSVPNVTGYSSAAGYDPATGLGSINAATLVNNWNPDFTIAASPDVLSVLQGSDGTTTVSTSVLGNFNSDVSLSASGLPVGATAIFSQNPIAAPGSGSSLLTITAGASTVPGSYPITITGSGGGMIHTVPVNLAVFQLFTITSSVTNSIGGTITPVTASVFAGGNVVLTITPSTGYHLSSLTDNGVNVTASVNNGTYAIMNVTTDHTVAVVFTINTYSVDAMVTTGSGTIVPAHSIVNYASPFTVTITPANGSTFGLDDNGMTVVATSVGDGSYTYTIGSVTEDHIIRVSFIPAAISPVPALGMWGMLAAGAVLGALVGERRRRNTQ